MEEAIATTLQEAVRVIGDIGTLGLLIMIVWWFYRGDVLSRRVYEELTEHFLERMSAQIVSGIGVAVKEAVREVLREISREERNWKAEQREQKE